jgi:hypothetical protein
MRKSKKLAILKLLKDKVTAVLAELEAKETAAKEAADLAQAAKVAAEKEAAVKAQAAKSAKAKSTAEVKQVEPDTEV